MKIKFLFSTLVATTLLFQGCSDEKPKDNVETKKEEAKVYNLTTGSIFGAYYQEGKTIGESMSKKGHSFKIVSSEGGEQNGRRVAKEISDFGFIQKDTHNLLSTMDSLYSNNVNVIAKMDDEAILFIVNKNSDIKSEKDIKDNKVKIAMTSKSAGSVSSLDTMGKLSKSFANKNIVYKDLDVAGNELKAKTIDVLMVVQSNTIKNDKLNDLLKDNSLEVVSISDKDLIETKINGKTVYNECNFNNVKTICTEALLISNSKVNSTIVSKLLETIKNK